MSDEVGSDEAIIYQITVRGSLDTRWSDWFSGLAITCEDRGDGAPISTLTGAADQAALRGILTRIWDLNLVLVAVNPVEKAERQPAAK